MRIETLADGLAFPEGPVFTSDGDLWFVEINGRCLTRWTSDGIERHDADGRPNGAAADAAGRIWFCDQERHAIRRLDPRDGRWEMLCTAAGDKPLNKPNDLAFDSVGNLVFTCPNYTPAEPPGFVVCLSPDGDAKVIGDAFAFCNGLAFLDDDATLVVAETHKHRLWKGRWDARTGDWIDVTPWAEVGGPVGPDGMAVGADGLLYVAVFGSGRIKAVDPAGEIVAEYELPGKDVTNCAFDPAGRLGLVVTETETGTLLSLPDLGPGQPLYDGGTAWA